MKSYLSKRNRKKQSRKTSKRHKKIEGGGRKSFMTDYEEDEDSKKNIDNDIYNINTRTIEWKQGKGGGIALHQPDGNAALVRLHLGVLSGGCGWAQLAIEASLRCRYVHWHSYWYCYSYWFVHLTIRCEVSNFVVMSSDWTTDEPVRRPNVKVQIDSALLQLCRLYKGECLQLGKCVSRLRIWTYFDASCSLSLSLSLPIRR